MANFINTLISKNRKKAFRPKKHHDLTTEWYSFFKQHGEGLYYSNIQSRNNNCVAKAISKHSKGLTHSIAILYSENLKDKFTKKEWSTINKSWNNYYGNTKELDDSIKVLILASADENGMNFLNFSTYQKRQQSIRKAKLSKVNERKVLKYLVSREPKIYDYTGLVFFNIYKACSFFGFLDDPEADFCSEIIYDAFKKGGLLIAPCDNPSPADIELYKPEEILFSNIDLKHFIRSINDKSI